MTLRKLLTVVGLVAIVGAGLAILAIVIDEGTSKNESEWAATRPGPMTQVVPLGGKWK